MNNKNDIQICLKISSEDKTIKAGIQGNQEAVNEFFNGIVPDFIKDGIGILSDQVKFWRLSKQIDIIKAAQAKIKSSGLSKQQVPLKVLIPIIQNSSLEEDLNMQDKWANMLANAGTGNVEVSPNYAAILNELSPVKSLFWIKYILRLTKRRITKKERCCSLMLQN